LRHPLFYQHAEPRGLVMTRQHGISYWTVITLIGFIMAVMGYQGIAAAERLSVSPSEQMRERRDGDHLSDELGLKKGVELKPRHAIDLAGFSTQELLLVTNQSCLASFRNIPFATAPLFGEVAEDGDWVLLAGVGWNKRNGFGSTGPVLIETADGHGLAKWYYTVQMLFIPKDHWSIRASLAFDSTDVYDSFVTPSQRFNPLQIGVAISFDYGAEGPMILDLGYGRLPLEGRVHSLQSISVRPDQAHPGEVLSESWIVSACLNIQF